jgi:hypothetical protein
MVYNQNKQKMEGGGNSMLEIPGVEINRERGYFNNSRAIITSSNHELIHNLTGRITELGNNGLGKIIFNFAQEDFGTIRLFSAKGEINHVLARTIIGFEENIQNYKLRLDIRD